MESAEAIPLMNGINQAAARPYSYGDMGMGFGASVAMLLLVPWVRSKSVTLAIIYS